MKRTLLITSALAVGLALLSASWTTAAAVTKAQCESRATECLGGCAAIDSNKTTYGSCVNRCDRNRTSCLDLATNPPSAKTTKEPGGKGTAPGFKGQGIVAPSGTAGIKQPSPGLGPSAPILKSPGTFQTTPSGPIHKSPGGIR